MIQLWGYSATPQKDTYYMIDKIEIASLMPPVEESLKDEMSLNLHNQSNFSTRPHHAQSVNSSYQQLQVRGLPGDFSLESEYKVRKFTDDKEKTLRNSVAIN